MEFNFNDRVKETTTTTGTGTLTLAGAATGFRAFSVYTTGTANIPYLISSSGGTEWEVGLGTYTSSGTTLSRDTILSSSNAGAAVSFSAGTKDVYVTAPSAALQRAVITLGTPVTLTTQTSIDFTGIPTGTKRIVLLLSSMSTNGSSAPIIQLGDSGGFETTGYTASAGFFTGASSGFGTNNTGFNIIGTADWASSVEFKGSWVLELLDSSTNTWVSNHLGSSATSIEFGSGEKSLSSELTQIRLTTVNGTDQFDAGTVNIQYK